MVGVPPPRSVRAGNEKSTILECLNCVLKIFQLFGFEGEVTGETITHWENLAASINGNWMKVAKYKLAAFFSAQMNLTLPKSPFPPSMHDKPEVLLGGAAYRWLRNFRRASQNVNNGMSFLSFLQSIKQSKKGMPRPDESALRQAEIDHVQKLTTAVKPNFTTTLLTWDEIKDNGPEPFLNIETMQMEIRRTVKEIFHDVKPAKYDWETRMKIFFPSTSANYINTRGKGGAVVSVLSDPDLLWNLRRPGGWMRTEIKRNIGEEAREPEFQQHLQSSVESIDTLDSVFQTLWLRMLRKAPQEEPLVKPVALAEALKVRTITKGPPIRQSVLRSLWKHVHGTLKKHRVFTLIGQPVTEQYILNQMGRNLADDEVYISGDYEAATDNLLPWVSNTVANALADELNLLPEERKLLLESLTGHIYEDEKGNKVRQATGQLMGSITSFPVLCIANAAMSRWAMELGEGKKILLRDAKLMINGDDVGIRSKRQTYHFWQTITKFGGLIESLGKTYVSRDFIDINSTMFARVPEPFELPFPRLVQKPSRQTWIERPDDWDEKEIIQEFGPTKFVTVEETVMRSSFLKLVPYVNLGLLLGFKRSSGLGDKGKVSLNDQARPNDNMGARARELVAFAPKDMHSKVMRMFIQANDHVLKRLNGIPWYVPEWLGGVGLPLGEWGQPSELDLRIASRILRNWKNERPISLAHQDTAWKIWQLAEQRMPEPMYFGERGANTEEYDRLCGRQVVNLLFDSRISMESLLTKITESKASRAIKVNSKLWDPKKGVADALPLEMLKFQAFYPGLPVERAIQKETKTRIVRRNGPASVNLD